MKWKGGWLSEQDDPDFDDTLYTNYGDFFEDVTYTWRRVIDQTASKATLSLLTLNIFFCGKAISQEAAAVFYRKNTFSFLGHHNWDPIISWVETIGSQNIEYLSKLEINAYVPDKVW
jgi:hypothetical protein